MSITSGFIRNFKKATYQTHHLLIYLLANYRENHPEPTRKQCQ